MAPYTKPETVLRRSDELLSVGQPMAALSSISEIFSSKRFRQTPLSSLEPIMVRFLDLCVDLRKGRTAKEGLHMYKNVAQNTSVQSVETIIQHFLKKSKAKLDEALAKVDEIEGPAVKPAPADANAAEAKEAPAEQTVGVDVEDLEASETPEGLLLSMVSEEKSRDRTYRELVTPWLRGLWEAYRTALDILRNNARLEAVYQQVATEAFQFCLAHARKTEFRRLCETLRSNLAASQKYSHQTHAINLSDPEVLQRHLDTRFQQLATSVDLELWQEAFRTAEDIHGLVAMSKKPPKASVMASFYDKMTKVFGVGQNFLFHAAAYNKYYALQVGNTTEEAAAEKLASAVLVSALAVPVGGGLAGAVGGFSRRTEGDESEAKGKLGRLAALLGFSTAPTRAGLLKDALARGTLKRASKDVRDLYGILEVDFHPLSITKKIEPILQRLAADPDTQRYVDPLKEVVLARLFQQLGQVYDSLKLARVVKLASFGSEDQDAPSTDAGGTRARVEKFVMEACRRGELDLTLDHAGQAVKFADRNFETDPASAAGLAGATAGEVLQPSSATLLRTHLTRLAGALSTSLDRLGPAAGSGGAQAAALAAQTAALTRLATELPKQRKVLLKRKAMIEERKRRVEEDTRKREREEAQVRAARMQQVAEEQQARIAKANRERELRRVQEEAERIRAKEREKVVKAVAESAGVKLDSADLANADTNAIIQMGVEQIEKDKSALAAKLKGVNKRLDHTERAMRREEIPLLEQDYIEQQARDRLAQASAHVDLVASLKAQHEQDLAIKKKLAKLMPDYAAHRDVVAKRRGLDFKAAEEKARKQIEAAKKKRRDEVLAAKQREREQREEEERLEREREARERAEAEEREREEAERKAKQLEIEEEQRQFKEAAEAKAKAAREERMKERAKLDEQAAKQRQRDEEIEARRQARKAEAAAGPARPAVPGSAAWRRENVEPAAATGARTPPSGSASPALGAAPGAGPSTERRPLFGNKTSARWREREAARADGTSTPPQSTVPDSKPPPADSSADGPPRRLVSGAAGSWREREARKASGAATPPAGASNANGENEWSEVRKPSAGAYRPPGATGGRTASGQGSQRKW